jgi:hypothetical protein
VKLLRTIRLDAVDLFVFEKAAAPGEWAVSGAFAFARDEPAKLHGKARSAVRASFLGLASLDIRRWCRLSTRVRLIADQSWTCSRRSSLRTSVPPMSILPGSRQKMKSIARLRCAFTRLASLPL